MSIIILLVVFIVRLVFLKHSMNNEKEILRTGGKEYGAQNTKMITVFHIFFYLGCLLEAVLNKSSFGLVSFIGLIIVLGSMAMLCVVVRLLGSIWTVKLMILEGHQFVDHWLFRKIKHPNYFLNIIPELIGLALLCHAKWTFMIIFPLYLLLLYRRIKEEDHLINTIILPNTRKSRG